MKKEYLVENFCLIVPEYPKMPTHYFIESYKDTELDPIDHQLVTTAIECSDDVEGLAKIGEVLLEMFSAEAVTNGYMGPNIYRIAVKIHDDDIGRAFISKAVKDLLHTYGQNEKNKKTNAAVKSQPKYFGQSGDPSKLTDEDVNTHSIKEKVSANIIELVNKLCDIEKSAMLQDQLKSEVLHTSTLLRKHNYKIPNKGLTSLLKKFGITK